MSTSQQIGLTALVFLAPHMSRRFAWVMATICVVLQIVEVVTA